MSGLWKEVMGWVQQAHADRPNPTTAGLTYRAHLL